MTEVRRASGVTLGVVLFAMLASACGTGGQDPAATCDEAFAQAVAIDPASDTVDNPDGAIASCASVETWVAAASRYPDSFGGQDPIRFARDRCATNAGIRTAQLCLELAGQ